MQVGFVCLKSRGLRADRNDFAHVADLERSVETGDIVCRDHHLVRLKRIEASGCDPDVIDARGYVSKLVSATIIGFRFQRISGCLALDRDHSISYGSLLRISYVADQVSIKNLAECYRAPKEQ